MKVVNNNAYKFYGELIANYDVDRINKGMDDSSNYGFVHAAIALADADAANPFEPNTEAYEHYFWMMRHYGLWRMGGADTRVSRRRFLYEAAQQASYQIENPFDYEIEPVIDDIGQHISIEMLKEAEYERAEREAIESETYFPVEDSEEDCFIVLNVEETDNDPVAFVKIADVKEVNVEDVLVDKPNIFQSAWNKIKNLFKRKH